MKVCSLYQNSKPLGSMLRSKLRKIFFFSHFMFSSLLCLRFISVLFYSIETFKWNKWKTKSHINTYFIKPRMNHKDVFFFRGNRKKKCVKNVMWIFHCILYSYVREMGIEMNSAKDWSLWMEMNDSFLFSLSSFLSRIWAYRLFLVKTCIGNYTNKKKKF